MNKKRLIGYLLVIVSVGCIHAQEKKLSVPEYNLQILLPTDIRLISFYSFLSIAFILI